MKLLFCCEPSSDERLPDDTYQAEAVAAERQGIPYSLISYEALVNENDATKAIRRVPNEPGPILGIYRGWMLKPHQYGQLYEALVAKGIHLINDPAAYRHCHYLPESYAAIEAQTPRSVWMNVSGEISMRRIMELLRPFGSRPLVIKDFVKSRKHEWTDACFIPSASDTGAVEKVVRRFLELQGEDLAEGLVFREFIEFEPLGTHPKSGMPLTKEFRLFFLDGQPVFWTAYWEEGNYEGMVPPIADFTEIASKVRSRFFTMDVAKRKDGGWMIVELGDGQVAGLPENADVERFYKALVNR